MLESTLAVESPCDGHFVEAAEYGKEDVHPQPSCITSSQWLWAFRVSHKSPHL